MAVILEILIARNSKKCILCYDTVYLQMYLCDLKFYEAIFNFNMCNTSWYFLSPSNQEFVIIIYLIKIMLNSLN